MIYIRYRFLQDLNAQTLE